MMLRKLDIHMQKDEIESLSHSIHENLHKIDYIFYFGVQHGSEHKDSHMLGKGSPAELHPRPGLKM